MRRFHRYAVIFTAFICSLAIFSQAFAAAPSISDIFISDSEAGSPSEAPLSSVSSAAQSNSYQPTALPNQAETVTDRIEPDSASAAVSAIPSPLSETSAKVDSVNEATTAPEDEDAAVLSNTAALSADEMSAARVIPFRLNSTITSSLPTPESSIAYTFNVSERGFIDMKLTRTAGALSADTGWIISLYEEYYINGSSGETAYRLLDTLKTDSTETQSVSSQIGVLPGSFRAVVTSDKQYSADSFSLCVNFTATNSYEIECNDAITRYTLLYPDLTVYGSSSLKTEADADYYMFRLTERGYAELSFGHENLSLTSVGWHVSLIDAQGAEYFSQTSRLLDTSVDSGPVGLEPGCYFVKILGHVHTTARYSLSLSIVETNDFETEPNDVLAEKITVGKPFNGATVSRSGAVDKDFFAFSLTSDGYINISFEHEADTQIKNGWNIRLYDSAGVPLCTFVSDWSVEKTVSRKIGLAKGSYYLCIDSEGLYLNSTMYTGTVEFTAASNYEKEPNNIFANATPLNKGAQIIGSTLEVGIDYDSDCYKITSTGGPLTVSFTHEALPQAQEGWVITLYNTSGNKLAPTDKNGNVFTNVLGSVFYTTSCLRNAAKTEVYFHNIPAGTYYIMVDMGLYYSYIDYTLSYN